MTRALLYLGIAAGLLAGCRRGPVADAVAGDAAQSSPSSIPKAVTAMNDKIEKTEKAWRQQLTPEQYQVLRQKGTERAFTGQFWNHKEKGTYRCAGCGQELFASETKFDSGCGWPSYYAPMQTNTVTTQEDLSHGMHRVEVLCSRCGGHLGHVFEDGPKPTGLRYCINSASLEFEPKGGGPKSAGPNKLDPPKKK